jgi:tRNA U38,U39,U40 pseudouridine synthase TruA
MSSFSPRAILDEKRYDFMAPTDDLTHIDELARLKMELAVLKNAVSSFCNRQIRNLTSTRL